MLIWLPPFAVSSTLALCTPLIRTTYSTQNPVGIGRWRLKTKVLNVIAVVFEFRRPITRRTILAFYHHRNKGLAEPLDRDIGGGGVGKGERAASQCGSQFEEALLITVELPKMYTIV